MRLTSLHIADLRVIESLRLEPGSGLNLIAGANGAGKTSVLEGIYLLGRGRTFRHSDAGPMVRRGADQTLVVGDARGVGDDEKVHRIGLSRGKREFACRIDGKDVKRRSELSRVLPLQYVGSQPQLLLDMGPEVRRRFLDMAVFHVEHGYLAAMGAYQRNLRQRNAAIRQGRPDAVIAWDHPFNEVAMTLDGYRRKVIGELEPRIQGLLTGWGVDFEARFRYRPGWRDDGTPLAAQLREKLENDLRQGFTGRGPHRAEWEIAAGGDLASKTLSRGQQKLLVFAMNLALVDLIGSEGKSPILLIDDLAAELDQENKIRLLGELDARGLQCFLTLIDESVLPLHKLATAKMFHVKQGRLSDC